MVDFMVSIRSRTLGPFTPVDPLREVYIYNVTIDI